MKKMDWGLVDWKRTFQGKNVIMTLTFVFALLYKFNSFSGMVKAVLIGFIIIFALQIKMEYKKDKKKEEKSKGVVGYETY